MDNLKLNNKSFEVLERHNWVFADIVLNGYVFESDGDTKMLVIKDWGGIRSAVLYSVWAESEDTTDWFADYIPTDDDDRADLVEMMMNDDNGECCVIPITPIYGVTKNKTETVRLIVHNIIEFEKTSKIGNHLFVECDLQNQEGVNTMWLGQSFDVNGCVLPEIA